MLKKAQFPYTSNFRHSTYSTSHTQHSTCSSELFEITSHLKEEQIYRNKYIETNITDSFFSVLAKRLIFGIMILLQENYYRNYRRNFF